MPKSKRNTIQNTQKTLKKQKSRLVTILDLPFTTLYILKIHHQKNVYVKQLRHSLQIASEESSSSKLVMGKTKVLKLLLTQKYPSISTSFLDLITGNNIALLLTTLSHEKVESILNEFGGEEYVEYARGGTCAPFGYTIPQGIIQQYHGTIHQKSQLDGSLVKSEYSANGVAMPATLFTFMKKCGLPCALVSGQVVCTKEFEVCREGVVLNSDQCAILKTVGVKMCEFKVELVAGFHSITENVELYE
jgi:hypothetical protein